MLDTYINKIINSAVFKKSRRQRELLSYLIRQMKDGNGSRIKGYVIALEVFKRSEHFDPSKDAIVRVEAGRLRNKLREYYETLGKDDPVEIILPKGTYAIQVINRDNIKNRDAHKLPPPIRLLNPQKLAVMPFCLIDIGKQDEHLVAEIADLLIFELIELDIIQVTSSKISLMLNDAPGLSRNQPFLSDAGYVFEASVQRVDGIFILMARIYSQSVDAYVWHNRFSFRLEEKKVVIQLILSEVNKFLVDEIRPINFDLFDLKDNVRLSA
jgi:TolB-like protein